MCGGVLTWSWTVRGRGTARSRSSVEAKAWGKVEAHEVSSIRSRKRGGVERQRGLRTELRGELCGPKNYQRTKSEPKYSTAVTA